MGERLGYPLLKTCLRRRSLPVHVVLCLNNASIDVTVINFYMLTRHLLNSYNQWVTTVAP